MKILRKFLFFCLLAGTAHAGIFSIYETQVTSMDLELDPYFFRLDFYITPFGRTNVGAAWGEEVMYRELLRRFLYPKTLGFEVAFHPMGWAGAMIRGQAYDVYTNLQWGTFNLVKALTLVQKEPWSASFFIGNAFRFRPGKELEKEMAPETNAAERLSDFFQVTGDDNRAEGLAASGLTVTAGNMLLIQNRAVEAWWLETSLKVRGNVATVFRKLHWNFDIGWRHTFTPVPIIDDTLWISAKRDRVDFASSALSILKNTRFDIRVDKGLSDWSYWKLTFLLGKSFPIIKATAARPKDRRVAFTLTFGFAATWGSPYVHEGMRRVDPTDPFHWIVMPTIRF